ncbi:threonine/homoserine/homoserine lactone efflux protein [Streptomyces sp. 3330]|uniref:hypothetical protein n=1 Tax=Streptomyces sp. 3330 TaxID=2817755 RepID=UPI0028616E58|nr:hypothetical protein [Streptomyces sp. 3330]MDR6979996.1 threonine/homoserine/homoserine lactone efflux protein [Streptomyces sp. 3330]
MRRPGPAAGAGEDGAPGDTGREAAGQSGWASYRGGLPRNPADPKAAVLALSFLPQCVPGGAPACPP